MQNMNSAFRMYEVDTGDFNVYEAYNYYSDVSSYEHLNAAGKGPMYEFEYSTREAYGDAAKWPQDAPLNATFWHQVTEAMEQDRELVNLQTFYQGRKSVKTPKCDTQECQDAKICYMRSGSTALSAGCIPGWVEQFKAVNLIGIID